MAAKQRSASREVDNRFIINFNDREVFFEFRFSMVLSLMKGKCCSHWKIYNVLTKAILIPETMSSKVYRTDVATMVGRRVHFEAYSTSLFWNYMLRLADFQNKISILRHYFQQAACIGYFIARHKDFLSEIHIYFCLFSEVLEIAEREPPNLRSVRVYCNISELNFNYLRSQLRSQLDASCAMISKYNKCLQNATLTHKAGGSCRMYQQRLGWTQCTTTCLCIKWHLL